MRRDVGDDAFRTRRLHIIAHFEGVEDQDHQAAGEVGQCALKCQTDCQTAGGDYRDHAAHGYAEDAHDADDQHDVQNDLHRFNDDQFNGVVEFGIAQSLLDEFADQFDDQQSDDQRHYGENEFSTV